MAIVTDLADAVVAELNGRSFSQPFAAERHYRPRFDLADLKQLRVSVIPGGLLLAGAARTQSQCDYEVDVAVQQRLGADESPQIDALMRLVEEIIDHFRLQRIASFPEAVWLYAENDPLYSLEHLDQLRQFTSVVTLAFRVFRK